MHRLVLACCAMSLGAASAEARQPVCADFSFPIYFKTGSAALAPTAAGAIGAAAKQFRKCRIASITVVGLSAPGRDKNLTEVRLHAVVAELEAKGLRRPPPNIAGAMIARRRAVMPNQAEVEIAVLH